MKKRKAKANDASELRRRAEKRLVARAKRTKPTDTPAEIVKVVDAPRLDYELAVHQVELELQCEELRMARNELEKGLARYRQLFDFAPIGYATIVDDGRIQEINHAGAAILGRERAALDALAEELVAKEMVSAQRLDEILVKAGATLPPAQPGPGAPPRIELQTPPAPAQAAATAVGPEPGSDGSTRR